MVKEVKKFESEYLISNDVLTKIIKLIRGEIVIDYSTEKVDGCKWDHDEIVDSNQMHFVSQEELGKMLKAIEKDAVIEYCFSLDRNSTSNNCMYTSFKRLRKYIRFSPNGSDFISSIRWENIHGKRRKAIKRCIKKVSKKTKPMIIEQIRTWNKYAGKQGFGYIYVNKSIAESIKKYMAIMGESENFEILEIVPWYRTVLAAYYDDNIYAVFFKKNKEEYYHDD